MLVAERLAGVFFGEKIRIRLAYDSGGIGKAKPALHRQVYRDKAALKILEMIMSGR